MRSRIQGLAKSLLLGLGLLLDGIGQLRYDVFIYLLEQMHSLLHSYKA
jgi:hypothetical protein